MTRIAITTINENGVLLPAFGERVGVLRPSGCDDDDCRYAAEVIMKVVSASNS